jgi:predicted ATP-grasp superfamily ATP-dependent carboligase
MPAVVLGDLSLVRPLVWAGVRVVVGTDDADDLCLRSRHVHSHFLLPGYGAAARVRSAAVLRDVGARLADQQGRRVPLFYGSDAQLAMLYDYRDLLEPVFSFVLTDADTGRAMLNKLGFAALCESRGVEAPRTRTLDDDHGVRQLRPPLLIKPRDKTDWHHLRDALFDGRGKARVFADADELLADLAVRRARDAVIVQEYVDADVAGLYSYHGFAAEDGRVLAGFCGRKVETYPAFAGESAIIELVHDPRVEAVGREVIAKLGLVGPFKVDLIQPRGSGALVTLEVNARFNLWHHLGAAHGVNLLQVAYDYLVSGIEPVASAYDPRIRWLSFYRVYRSLLEAGHGRAAAVAGWAARSLQGPTIHDVFDWRDPAPFLGLLQELLGGKRDSAIAA